MATATGGGGARSSPECISEDSGRGTLTCPLCLQVFTSPKLLPCSHTFCLKCLEGVMSRRRSPSHTLSCPRCHRDVTVPSGGVAAFPNNISSLFEKPHEAQGRHRRPIPAPRRQRQQDQALNGAQKAQELPEDPGGRPGLLVSNKPGGFCGREAASKLSCPNCHVPVCCNCVLMPKELQRPTSTEPVVSEVQLTTPHRHRSETSEKQLLRLPKAVSHMTEAVEAEKREQQALRDKKTAVEKVIQNRHATLVAMADKFRDELLDSLDTECREMADGMAKALHHRQKNLNKLSHLQQQLEQAMHSEASDSMQLLSAVQEMKEGRGSPEAVSRLILPKRTFVCRPVVRSELSNQVLMQSVQDFFGTVSKLRMECADPEVTVTRKFRCGTEPDIEVFFLFPTANDRLLVSYARRGLREDAPNMKFDQNGKHRTRDKPSGRVSWKQKNCGKIILQKSRTGCVHTYAKSSTKKLFFLENDLSGRADINRKIVSSEETFKLNQIMDFRIKVGAHRAFDVDASEQLFVVLEEPQPNSKQRKVRLYRRDNEDAIATYTPPSASCQPSDVCFYRLGGRQVLLVSDEGNDAIHVVDVQDRALTFLRYLAPGCPLLVQPTALNTDIEGRLWVACRGGDILTMTPVC